MSESEGRANLQAARERFDEVVRDMERFILNLDPSRAQVLRDWLRSLAGDQQSAGVSGPSLEGWPLAERIGELTEAVLAARTAMRQVRRVHRSERDGHHTTPVVR
jgi:hypothetical protein